MNTSLRSRVLRPDTPGLGEALADLLLDLCAIPSPTGAEGPLASAVAESLARAGLRVERADNAVVARAAGVEQPAVALVGHLDTVPPAPGGGPPRVEAGRVYGRGASDMKAGLAMMLALARSLPPERAPGLVFYDREEGAYADNGLEPVLDRTPWLAAVDLAILLEPTDGTVQPGCQGSLHAWARFVGRPAHSARPWQGDNAIHQAAGLLAALASRPPRRVEIGGLTFLESLSATLARGGATRNVIPADFEVNLNLRFPPDRTLAEAEAFLEHFARTHGASDVEIVDRAPPGPVRLDHPVVQRLLAAAGGAVEAKLGWTDVARLAARGIPAVNYGPGITSQAHQAAEYTDIAGLVQGYRVLWTFLGGP